MKLTSTPIAWNTGALYRARGQRIAAARIDGVPHFADLDRNLAYSFTCEGEITKDYVMHVYHHNLGKDESWQVRDMLAPFAEDVTPCNFEFLRLAKKVEAGEVLTAEELEMLPGNRDQWSSHFLLSWAGKAPKPQYMVECDYAGGWSDAEWTETDAANNEKPWRFDTVEEAQAEIDDLIETVASNKDMEPYHAEDYRVVPAYVKWEHLA